MSMENEDPTCQCHYDPMDAITEKVLGALKPRKIRRVRKYHVKSIQGDVEFTAFKDQVLAPSFSMRKQAHNYHKLLEQVNDHNIRPITEETSLDELVDQDNAQFSATLKLVERLSADIGLECRDRGDVLQEHLAKLGALFARVVDAAKDTFAQLYTGAERMQAQAKTLETAQNFA